jgi:hypothetical protein
MNSKTLVYTVAAIGLVAAGAGYSTRANAGCAQYVGPPQTNALGEEKQLQGPLFRIIPAAFQQDADDEGVASPKAAELPAIVGLWKFQLQAKGNQGIPDGTEIDFGLQTWHSDYTEILNSGARPPPSGNICMGAWERVGHHQYRLHHVGESWNDAGTAFIGPADIREELYVEDDRNHFSGTFSITQYSIDGKTVLAFVKGVATGTRITPN